MTDALLKACGLDVPESADAAVEVLAKQIMFNRIRDDQEAKSLNEIIRTGKWGADVNKILKHRKKEKEKESENMAQKVRTIKKRERLTERIASAINQTNALLTNKGNICNHRDKLRAVLSNINLVFELALIEPPTDVNQILRAIDDHSLIEDDLNGLMQSLKAILDGLRQRTGRPKDSLSKIITSAARVWTCAGKTIECSYYDEKLSGDFFDFLMAVYTACGLSKPKGKELAALNERLRSMHL